MLPPVGWVQFTRRLRHLQISTTFATRPRCSRCAHPRQCSAQLAQLEGGAADPALVDAPDYCRNRDLLGYLKEEGGV
ncbi:DUF6455 family protein [Pseudophaeobacter sp.]|uniref:DUF6455 family protein n=1 Tax=Pseudophaeobacter sp. TaxID=1971739 RepID=UPI0032D98039